MSEIHPSTTHRKAKIDQLDIFGETVETAALARVLSTLCAKSSPYRLEECTVRVRQSMKKSGHAYGKYHIVILYDSLPSSRSAKLLEVFYELRFSLEWLGPVVIIACPNTIKEIRSVDLFRMTCDDQCPVPQKCIPSPLRLCSLLNALGGLDGYGRFAWRQIQQGIHDKDLIRQARQLGRQLAADMGAGRELATAMNELRDLLRANDGALVKFMQYHVDLSLVERALSEQHRHQSSTEMRQGAEELLRATNRLPLL